MSALPATAASRRTKLRTPLSAHGEPLLWLTGGALVVCLVMVVGLLVLVLVMGLSTFWPARLERVTTVPGRPIMGEVTQSERYRPEPALVAALPPAVAARAQAEMAAHAGQAHRRMLRTGNYELTYDHYTWISDYEIADEGRSFPEWGVVVERIEWGRFYGFPKAFLVDGDVVADEPATVWSRYEEYHPDVRARFRERKDLEKHALGRTFRTREQARLEVRGVELEHELAPAWARLYRALLDAETARSADQSAIDAAQASLARFEAGSGSPPREAVAAYRAALEDYRTVVATTERENARIIKRIQELNGENARLALTLTTADGQDKVLSLEQIVRAYPANQLSFGERLGLYLERWWEFLCDEPREANSEGGVFPAIVGTVLMTLIMALLVVPFGVLAALYLREYARAGPVVSAIRIAINNLAGVPSIVFGVFGLGFFCYGVGSFIDAGAAWDVPRPLWLTALAGAALLAAGAFLTMLLSLKRPGRTRSGWQRSMRLCSGILWLSATVAALGLVASAPFFEGFYRAQLPNPTFGKGTLVWASFTLALLTLPVVIVATEESLAAVPNSMREGSYACGAGKWQTIQRIVLPRAMPGIMTGMILAMARGAGEVAPLMLVGAVKLAPELPISPWPREHFGIDRSFMHLGFHIYDLGFQSQNSEAAKPLVFTTTLLLILIIALLNLSAVQLRSRLKRKFVGAQF